MTELKKRVRQPKYDINLTKKEIKYMTFVSHYKKIGRLKQYKKIRIRRYNFDEDCYDDCLTIEDVDKISIELFKEKGYDDHTINNLIIKRHKEYKPNKSI